MRDQISDIEGTDKLTTNARPMSYSKSDIIRKINKNDAVEVFIPKVIPVSVTGDGSRDILADIDKSAYVHLVHVVYEEVSVLTSIVGTMHWEDERNVDIEEEQARIGWIWEMDINASGSIFCGNSWGEGASCMCRDVDHVVAMNYFPILIGNESHRKLKVQHMAAMSNRLRSILVDQCTLLWNKADGQKPVKRWDIASKILTTVHHATIELDEHIANLTSRMQQQKYFKYVGQESCDNKNVEDVEKKKK